jgi:hypothetical protein
MFKLITLLSGAIGAGSVKTKFSQIPKLIGALMICG